MPQALTERIIIPMSKELLETIEDFRFSSRMKSRADAIRFLIQEGLAATAQEPKKAR